MANIKQQKKRVLTNENARQRNMSVKSEVKTAIKKVEAAAKAGNKEEVAKLANEAFKLIDESVFKLKILQQDKNPIFQKQSILLNNLKKSSSSFFNY